MGKGVVGLAVKVGVQLYSVRKALAKDLYGTLQRVAESGYRYVEAANPNPREDPGIGFGLPALEAKKLLGDLGLKVIGSHIGGLQPDTIEPVLDYHAELGNPQIGCPIEFFLRGTSMRCCGTARGSTPSERSAERGESASITTTTSMSSKRSTAGMFLTS